MSHKQASWKPPLPTPEQLAKAPITMSGIALRYWVERAFPGQPLPQARCKGQAPKFDTDKLPGETPDTYKKRIRWAQEQCSICHERYECATNAIEDPDPAGILAGIPHLPSGQTTIRKAAA